MEAYKRAFIEFMLESDVLLFGDFVTKSGRRTPYFVNTGRYRTGSQLLRLGEFYAATAQDHFGGSFDVLFGPAYKGIPLVCATAASLARDHGLDTGYAFDRKEAKDHGEGGSLVGHPFADGDRVLILEDVTTAGTSIRETVPKLRSAADIALAGLVVSVDRAERGKGDASALTELSEEFDMPCRAIVTIHEVIEHLHGREVDGKVVLDDELHGRMLEYLEQYGARG